MTRSRLALPALTLAALAACADAPTTATSPRQALSFEVTAEAPSARHVFVFTSRNSVPADFAARVAALGGTVDRSLNAVGIAAVSGLSAEAAASLGASGGIAHWNEDVEVVTPKQVMEPVAESMDATFVDGGALSEAASPSNPTTASFFPRQWHLRQIGAHTAWAAGKLGSPNVRVGILDTGLDYTHPDLAGRVNLALSKSFVPEDAPYIAYYFPGAHEIADLQYHGTHVGATVSSNALAAAGVTSQVTLVGIKVLNRNGSGNSFNTLDAIVYAADIGLDVINMSLGIRNPLPREDYAWFNEMINRVMEYAHAKGTTVVVSAGNESMDMDKLGNGFKAYCTASTVVCVSATGPASRAGVNGPWYDIDGKASYTNYGREYVSVAAPGGNGASSVTAACSRFSLAIPVCRTGTYVLGINGTSMASPHVTGLAALMVEKYGRKPGQVKEALGKFADDLGPSGQDPVYGKGRINVAKALGL